MKTESRKILRRTHGRRHGPITRLMSPSDFGHILKPFVFLDHFDLSNTKVLGELHPHSGIATLTYLFEGRADLIDPDGKTVVLPGGGVEWMQAGKGMWHGGGIGDDNIGRVRGFQLWIALSSELELGPTLTAFQSPEDLATSGPVKILLGNYSGIQSHIQEPASMNYLAVSLKAGERWVYTPPAGHSVLWISTVAPGLIANGNELGNGELVAFESSEEAVSFEATADTQFVLGSAVPHPHDLSLAYYSVHTSAEALEAGEAQIEKLAAELSRAGRLKRAPYP